MWLKLSTVYQNLNISKYYFKLFFYSRKSLTNQKLKALHTELKVLDKEAMALKKLLADGTKMYLLS